MGNMQQMAWAEAVSSGDVPLESALMASFQGNFYPPLDLLLVAPTAEAIREVASLPDDPEALANTWVLLPAGLRTVPKAAVKNDDGVWIVRVLDLIDATRTFPFVEALGADTQGWGEDD